MSDMRHIHVIMFSAGSYTVTVELCEANKLGYQVSTLRPYHILGSHWTVPVQTAIAEPTSDDPIPEQGPSTSGPSSQSDGSTFQRSLC